MGLNTLNNRSAGETIVDTFFNDIHSAMNGDFVGRNSTGVPTSAQNLGTVALPWGVIRGSSLVLGGSAVDTSSIVSPQNRVISGAKRATSNQPAFIVPNGAAASFVIDGTPTNLVFDVNGSEVSVTTDLTKSSLTTAPSSNNTALVDEASASDQYATKTWGEYGADQDYITIGTVGSEISGLVGNWAAFSIAGVSTEYFLAFVESSTTLTKCMRGFFYNSSLAPVNRSAFSNGDTITLLSLAWIFIENDATTVDVTYNNPIWSVTSPGSPATGDYWYDLANEVWKRYDGASFQTISRTFIGMAILDTSNCIGARCADFHAKYALDKAINLEVQSTEIIRTSFSETRVSVAGNDIRFRDSLENWNITTDLATSADMYDATEQVSRRYYLYLKDTGETVISDIHPYRRLDLLGFYHPHNPWRAVGYADNDGSSDLVSTSIHVFPLVTVQDFTSGSGTYLKRDGIVSLDGLVLGGGAGGGGGGTSASAGTAGNNTTFGSGTANGGSAGTWSGTNGGAGGGGTLGTGWSGIVITGGSGTAGTVNGAAALTCTGGMGGNSSIGGGGSGQVSNTGTGGAGATNTGGGGGGGGTNSVTSNTGGNGGGSGGTLLFHISNPLSSYSYSIGASAAGGASAANGAAGGSGGSGRATIRENWNHQII